MNVNSGTGFVLVKDRPHNTNTNTTKQIPTRKAEIHRYVIRYGVASWIQIRFGLHDAMIYIIYNPHDLHVSYIFTKNDVNIPPLYHLDILSTFL